MVRHTLFVIHGIGKHPAGWADNAQTKLRERWNGINTLKSIAPASRSFELVPLSYDSVFESVRKRWRDDLDSVRSALGEFTPPPGAFEALTELWELGEKDNFATTHVLDLVLYQLIPTFRHRVGVTVFAQLRKELSARMGKKGFETWSVVGHSMGTAVAHDTLQGAVMREWDAIGGALPTGTLRMKALMMLANCSELLERKAPAGHVGRWPWDVYESDVWPSITDTGALCQHYLDVAHRLDPVAMPKPFSPKANRWPGTNQRIDPTQTPPFVEIDLTRVIDANVHALEHYLDDPDCYVPLFRILEGDSAVSDEELERLRREHRDQQAHVQAIAKTRREIEKWQDRLSLTDIAHYHDVISWARRLVTFFT